jgi:hypothetical protein
MPTILSDVLAVDVRAWDVAARAVTGQLLGEAVDDQLQVVREGVVAVGVARLAKARITLSRPGRDPSRRNRAGSASVSSLPLGAAGLLGLLLDDKARRRSGRSS